MRKDGRERKKRDRWRMTAALLACCLGLSGCGMLNQGAVSENQPNLGAESQNGKNKKEEEAKASAVSLADPEYPNLPDREKDWDAWRAYVDKYEVEESFLSGIQEFSYRTACSLIESREQNLVYSPLSLYYALSLAASGTGGETRQELADFLGMGDALADFESNAEKLYHLLNRETSFSQLHIASSLWVSPELSLKESFLDTAKENYYAAVYRADFTDAKTGQVMGDWVKKETKGLIAPEIRTTPQEVMHLFNTVYFKAEWIDAFPEKNTKDDIFYPENGEKITVPFMNREFGSQGFYVGEGFTRSFLSLKDGSYMAFVLPDEGMPVEALASSPERLKEALEGGEQHMGEVKFQVPKFEADSSCDGKAMMEELGITKLFDGGDFSPMTEYAGIFVSSITQDSHIAVNEKGVEAASFTDMAYEGAAMTDGRAEMILNRPFLYGICDNGVWLFIGICDSPQ